MLVTTAVLCVLIGLAVGSFLTFQLLVSYDEAESYDDYDYDFNELEAALPSNATKNDSAVVKENQGRLVGDTKQIREIFAQRRQGGGRN